MMAATLNLDELKKIRASVSHLIFGFCRQSHQQLLPQDDPYYDIQPLIIYTCLAFYHIKHEWDTNIIDSQKLLSIDDLDSGAYGDNVKVVIL